MNSMVKYWEHQQTFLKNAGKISLSKICEKISFPKKVRFSHRKNGGEISSKFEKVVLNACDGGIFGDINKKKFRIFEKVAEY